MQKLKEANDYYSLLNWESKLWGINRDTRNPAVFSEDAYEDKTQRGKPELIHTISTSITGDKI